MSIKSFLLSFFLFLGIFISPIASYAIDLKTRIATTDYISPETVDGAVTIDTAKAYELWESRAIFIDTRSNVAFEAGRIPGAELIPYEPGKQNQSLTEASLAELVAKDEPVICYCNGLKCDRAPWCAALALEWGWTEVYYYREGFPAWVKAGHPSE